MAVGTFKGYLAGYLPINLIQALIALGAVVVYTRLLAPDQYGHYALAITAIQWLQSVLFFWLHSGVARFYEARRVQGQLPSLLTVAYGSGLGLSGLLALAIGLAAVLLDDPWRWLVMAALATLIARSLLLIGLEAHRAAHRVGRYTVIEGAQCVLGLGLGALLAVETDGSASAVLWGTALATGFVLLLDAPRLRQLTRPLTWSGDEWRRLSQYGFPLAASALLSQVIMSSDRFFIAWLIDDKAVGLYSVAYALADRPSAIVFNWVGMAAVPIAFTAMEREGVAAARQVMEHTGKSLILLLLPCTVGLAAVATPLATVLIGAEFRQETARLIPWIALASLLYGGMVHYAAHAFLITQNTRWLLWTNLIVVILNVTLNVLLIPPLGLDGAVAASIATYGFGLILRLVIARRFFPVPLLGSHVLRVLLACGVMAAFLHVAALPATLVGLILSMVLGVVAYSISIVLFNVAGSRCWIMNYWRQRTPLKVSSHDGD